MNSMINIVLLGPQTYIIAYGPRFDTSLQNKRNKKMIRLFHENYVMIDLFQPRWLSRSTLIPALAV